jgi:hypothetical protein
MELFAFISHSYRCLIMHMAGADEEWLQHGRLVELSPGRKRSKEGSWNTVPHPSYGTEGLCDSWKYFAGDFLQLSMAGENELVALEDFTGFANWSQPTRCPVPGRILNLSHCLTVACLCYITSSPEAYSSAYHSSRIIKSNTYLFKTLRRGIAVVW